MQQTFLELVPRCQPSLRQSMNELEALDISFDGYNIPELVTGTRAFLTPEEILQIQSQDSFARNKKLILHLRTRKHSVQHTLDRLQLIAQHRVSMALLVTGDPAEHEQGPCTHAHDVVAACEHGSPLPLAVAADVYQPDWGRWQHKKPFLGTAIHSVFTQPIFHTSFFEDIASHTKDALQPEQVHIGITWMTTERTRRYWHERNSVPLGHLPKGNSEAEIRKNSIAQAVDILRSAKQQQYSIYIMFMRNTIQQLQQVLEKAENIQEI